jgi:hypothetical protein
MYLGRHSICLLRAFLDGYQLACEDAHLEVTGGPDFHGLHDWVAQWYGRTDSPRGWCGIILEECGGDDAKALEVFFTLLDEYRQSGNLAP